jgi:putative tryptophan/tyrosine transport system substrate-binding protein
VSLLLRCTPLIGPDLLYWSAILRLGVSPMNRRALISLLGGAAAWPLSARAQQREQMRRVGLLWPGAPPDKWDEAFLQGLRAHGYVEGRNILLEYRWAEGNQERLPILAEELARLPLDVIVTIGATAILALKRATTSIPIVFAGTSDPVRTGFAASLARPGGNLTGLSLMAPDLAGKRLELIKSVVPGASRIAMLWNASDQGMAIRVEQAQLAAPAVRVTLLSPELRTLADLESAFVTLTGDRPDALLVFVDPFTVSHRQRIVDFAAASRLPAIYEDRVFLDAGGLMSYGPSVADNCRRAATYVDKILKGAKPGDLPIEQPTKFELIINLKTAKALGIELSPTVLALADEVIE